MDQPTASSAASSIDSAAAACSVGMSTLETLDAAVLEAVTIAQAGLNGRASLAVVFVAGRHANQ